MHDILDYTLLSKSKSNFMKNLSVFDIRIAIRQIIEILSDKIKMKDIKVLSKFNGFISKAYSTQCYLINSDMKRLQ